MEKIKEFFSNKKNIVICASVALVIIVAIVLIMNLGGSKGNKLEKRLKELGNVYYEKYHGLFDDKTRAEFLAKYTTIGIKVDLENLARTVADTNGLPSKDEILKEFVKNGKACNQTTTKVIFYPQKPFGAKDFKMEINLDCGE